ncbi:undecaprenyldiphospho-muramoylpentapeptide beta-N-acetylglucosaminyltransferase [Patescibacteria group bacterium]|nr:undecaprenyldiphospho-muramoylpentapeptide beta-N-acetylglucosaminyltransferase [Patescibacteria group bacterium]
MKILLTGGGTAGHIFPLIAVIRQMKKNYSYDGFDFFYIGPRDKEVKNMLEKEGVTVKTILAGKFRRYFSFSNILDLFKLPISIIQSFYYVFVISPDVIFSKGGYGSVTPALAGRILNVPIFLHESDVVPGLANKIVGNFAIEIFIAFSAEETEYFPAEKKLSVGNPILEEVINGDKKTAKKMFEIKGDKPVVLIIGGSQGAVKVNDTILANLPSILEEYEIIHQTGLKNFEQVKKEVRVILSKESQEYYHPTPFLKEKELANAYAIADLVVSRAGAGGIFEIAAVGKPSILIPLAGSAQDHQVRNAYAYAKKGAALVIEEPNFKPHFILERINHLFKNPEKMELMAEKAKDFARPDAARIVSDYLITYLTQ